MSLFVKICGLCSARQVRDVAALSPDAIGFVFWPRSKRAARPEDVAAWTADLPTSILKVGVFVDETERTILEAARVAGLDALQLHAAPGADGTFPDIGKLRADFSKHWKKNPAIFQTLENRPGPGLWAVAHVEPGLPDPVVSESIDAVLVDSYSPESPGGTGRVADWERAAAFVRGCRRPVLLAGGLNTGNVREAVGRVRPAGVDVSSGVESTPGVKDIEKVSEFIGICRSM